VALAKQMNKTYEKSAGESICFVLFSFKMQSQHCVCQLKVKALHASIS
jgi:hypothetical protein